MHLLNKTKRAARRPYTLSLSPSPSLQIWHIHLTSLFTSSSSVAVARIEIPSYLLSSFETNQSIPSNNPKPVNALHPIICHSLSLRSVRPKASETWAGVIRLDAGRSCLFANTRRRADFRSYMLVKQSRALSKARWPR